MEKERRRRGEERMSLPKGEERRGGERRRGEEERRRGREDERRGRGGT